MSPAAPHDATDATDGRTNGRRWTVRDVIDFEYLVRDDLGFADDSAWFAARSPVAHDDERRDVFLAWLAHARARIPSALPGAIYATGRGVMRWLAALVGVVTGAVVCGGLLNHGAAEPVNALVFLAVTVGLQIAVLVVAIVAWVLQRAHVRLSGLRTALLAAIGLAGRALARLDGERRTALRAGWAAIDFRSRRLAPLIGVELLVVTQVFAIAFNLGLLGAMLFVHLPFEELRFGWQSTYDVSSSAVSSTIRAIAAPWRWLASGLVPDAAQVDATRYVRGQRAETLPAAAAHAWWPFLIAAVVCYGLLVRSALAVVATLVLRGRLARIAFTFPAANALWRVLHGPLVRADASGASLPDAQPDRRTRRAIGVALLVLDDDLAAREDAIRTDVERRLAGRVARAVVVGIDDDARVRDLPWPLAEADATIVAVRAERDPIVAIAAFLRALRDALPARCELSVLLVADLADQDAAVPVDAALARRVEIWRRFAAIQRLDVGVERAP